MPKKHDWRRFFPFDEPRAEQIAAIDFVLDAFLNKGKTDAILELGTGVGKSAVAITLSRYLDAVDQNVEPFSPGALFLTSQKILQEQYMRDFSCAPHSMTTIKSSSNFQCLHHVDQTCGESLRILRALKNKADKQFRDHCRGSCPYLIAKRAFLDAKLSVTNYAYFFAETMHGGAIQPRELLVMDESHAIEGELSKFVEIKFSMKFARSTLLIKHEPKRPWAQASVMQWIGEQYEPALLRKIADLACALEDVEDVEQLLTLTHDYDRFDKHICKVHRLQTAYRASDWVMNYASDRDNSSWEFKPIDVSPWAHDQLYRFGRRRLFMSATIVDSRFFRRLSGISSGKNVASLSIGTPFPVKNRPIIYAPVGSMSAGNIDNTMPSMINALRMILQQHADEKGIFHCNSFKIVDKISESLAGEFPRLLIQHRDRDREELIATHCRSDGPTVIVSPSLTEGIDLKDDLSRFQVFCKIPYPYLGDLLVQKKMQRYSEWYDYMTLRTILQASGRSIRSMDDFAVTYMLDSMWEYFYEKNKESFPRSFREALTTL